MSIILMLTKKIKDKNFKNRFFNSQMQQRYQVDKN